jgi:hypothetical protein
MSLKSLSWEQRLESLLPKPPRWWPLTWFGTLLLVLFLASVGYGAYQWISCLMLRGLLQ